ncbi:hypothetical protein JQN58_05765 [Aneurinibacillus sp. BA2021]|nr:hypothetical protein [Aneurinibacillus sp. BA2021]
MSSAVWYWITLKQTSVLEAGIPPEGRAVLMKETESVQPGSVEHTTQSLSHQMESIVMRVPLHRTLDEFIRAQEKTKSSEKRKSVHIKHEAPAKNVSVVKLDTGACE